MEAAGPAGNELSDRPTCGEVERQDVVRATAGDKQSSVRKGQQTGRTVHSERPGNDEITGEVAAAIKGQNSVVGCAGDEDQAGGSHDNILTLIYAAPCAFAEQNAGRAVELPDGRLKHPAGDPHIPIAIA